MRRDLVRNKLAGAQIHEVKGTDEFLPAEGNIPKGSELSSDGGSNLIGSANGIVTEVVSQDAADVSASDAVGLENLTLEPGSGSKSKAEADEQKRVQRSWASLMCYAWSLQAVEVQS